MDKNAAIAIVGTFDSKGEEHLFLKKCIERRRIPTLTINVGTNGPSPFPADIDLYSKIIKGGDRDSWDRDEAIQAVLSRARILVRELYRDLWHHLGRRGNRHPLRHQYHACAPNGCA